MALHWRRWPWMLCSDAPHLRAVVGSPAAGSGARQGGVSGGGPCCSCRSPPVGLPQVPPLLPHHQHPFCLPLLLRTHRGSTLRSLACESLGKCQASLSYCVSRRAAVKRGCLLGTRNRIVPGTLICQLVPGHAKDGAGQLSCFCRHPFFTNCALDSIADASTQRSCALPALALQAPHSCGNQCNRENAGCGHPCVLLCHPGPCPPCPRIMHATCYCGQVAEDKRCGRHEFTCGSQCSAALPCGHGCQQTCHEVSPCPAMASCSCCGGHHRIRLPGLLRAWQGTYEAISSGTHWTGALLYSCSIFGALQGACPPCALVSTVPCLCGAEQQEMACSERGVHRCARPCNRPLACGLHTCERGCHAGSCGMCPLAGPKVSTTLIFDIHGVHAQGKFGAGAGIAVVEEDAHFHTLSCRRVLAGRCSCLTPRVM